MKTRITIALVAILLIAGITFIIIKPNNITSSAVFNYDLAKANQGINLTQLFGQHTQFYIRPTEGINAAITNDILTVKSTEGEKTIVVYVIDGNKVVKHALSITNNTIKKIEPKIEEPKVEDEVKQELKQTNKVKVIITFTPEEQTYLQSLTPEKQIEEKKRIVKQKIEELKTKLSKKNELTGAATGIDEAVTITQEYETIEAIAAEITLEGLELLESNPEIQGVFIDRELSLQLSDSVPLIRADLVHGTLINGTNITGKGKAVCVLDTGIDYNHPAFTGRIIGGHDFVNNDDSAQDDNSISHGTHVSGIIASNNDSYKGVAPEANIVPTKVCNSQGSCSASNILAGIDYCTAHAAEYNITAISGSIGDGGSYNTDNCPTYFDNALSAATDLGIINVFASGNQGHTNGVSYPSCSPHTISVGASTKSDGLASFTNRGERLDILAPGTNILSTSIGGFRSLSGTSMSTPHVAGTIALLRQAADLTGKQITLNSTRKLLKDTGFNINTYLRIDAKRAADNIQPAPQQNKTNKTTAKTVKMNELLTDTRSNAPVAKKIQDDPNFETFFTNVTTNTTHLLVQFYHNGTTQQPVWVEGLSSLEAINLTNAPPNQEITVAVALINGYIPRFTLHVGPASDIFLFGITIINIQSYPTVGGNWTVIFNTSGQANLSITAINGTTFGTDLQFLKLTCGDTTLPTTWNGTSYVAPNYSCNTNGSEISKVLTPGKHTLQFNFGDSEAYAFNLAANSCPILINVSTELTNNVHSNGTCITFNAANITLNCQGFNITYDPGFNGGYAINNTNLTNNTIRDCFIRQTNWSATTGTAIFLYDANNTRIFNTSINVIDNRSFGIEMFRASSSIINNVTITSNQSPGIIITQSSNITIANTTVNTNTSDAIRINGSALISTSNNITLRDITAFSSNSSALSIISSGNITIINFTGISRNGTAYSHDFSTGDVTIRNSRFSTNESIAASIDGNRHHIYNTILSVSHGIALQLLTITDVNISNITLRTNSTWLTTNPVSNFMNLTNTLFEDDNGSIRIILNMTLGSSINISKSNLNITGNRVFVNSTTNNFLNQSAQITLNNLTTLDAFPTFDEDTGILSPCYFPRCRKISYNGGILIFNVTQFTSYSTREANINVTISKFENEDPTRTTRLLNYTIEINFTEGNASNVTVVEFYPNNTIFNGSQPTPNTGSNTTWTLGNFTAFSSFRINITLNISNSANNTVINNSVNVSFQNITGFNTSVAVRENTTILRFNFPPTIAVIVNSTFGNNTITENITVYPLNATDADGDPVENITDWRKNGVSIAVVNMPFETNTSFTNIVKDYSQHGNNGTLGNGSTANASTWNLSGRVGGAYIFDKRHFIEIPNSPSLNITKNLTISVWFRPNEIDIMNLICKSNGQSIDYCLRWNGGGGLIRFYAKQNFTTGTTIIESSSGVNANVWTHVAVVFGGDVGSSFIRIYVNGTDDNSGTFGSNIFNHSSLPIRIGGSLDEIPSPFNGTIDEVLILNTTLSAAQVFQLYNDTRRGRHLETISNTELTQGDNWTTAVTPNDHIDDGTTTFGSIIISDPLGRQITACGDLLSGRNYLANDVTATATCFNVTQNNATLDCINRTITFSTLAAGSGVYSANRSNVEIHNCRLNQSLNGPATYSPPLQFIDANNVTIRNNFINASRGIALQITNANNSLIVNNTIFTNGSSDNYGIQIRNVATNTTIINNSIRTTGSSTQNYGIILSTDVQSTTIANNTITTNGSNTNIGIEMTTRVNNTLIENNTIRTNGSGGNNYGIEGLATNTGAVVRRNLITTGGGSLSSTNIAVRFTQTNGNTTIVNNTIRTSGESSDNDGIELDSTIDVNITNNSINTNGGGGSNRGFDLTDVRNAQISTNNIIAYGTGNNVYGLYILRTLDSTIANNTFTTNSTGNTNIGLNINGPSGNISIDTNTITTDQSSSDGIVTETTPSTNITNNRITTTSGSTSYGIRLRDESRRNRVINNTIRTGVSGTGSTNTGIYLQSSSVVTVRISDTVITNNNITTSGTGTSYGFYSQNSVTNTTFHNNTIQTGLTGAGNNGIYLNLAENNSINGNTIITTGTGSDYGVRLETQADHNIFNFNNLTTNESSSYGLFIESSNSTFINTILNSSEWISQDSTQTNITNITFTRSNGSIRVNINELLLNGSIRIQQTNLTIAAERAFINSTQLPFLNQTARVTLYNLNNTASTPNFDPEDDGTYTLCLLDRCQNITNAGTTLSFDVVSFTSYSTTFPIIVNKTHAPTVLTTGAYFNYTINITNVGGATQFNLTVNDTFDANTTFISSQPPRQTDYTWNFTNISGGQTILINITARVNLSFTEGTNVYIRNLVNITYSSNTSNIYNLSANETALVNLSGITLTKLDSTDPVNCSSNFTYQINITNNLNETVFNLSINDTYSTRIAFQNSQPNTTSGTNNTWNFTNISAGQTIQINITVERLNDTGNNSFSNFVTVSLLNAQNSSETNFTTSQITESLLCPLILPVVEPTPQPTGGGTTLPPMGGSGASRGAHAAAATSAASTAAAASSAASPGIIRQYNATPRWQLNYTHLQKNPISCGYGANGTSQEIQIQQTEPKKVPLPKDYEIITKPFKFTCEGNDLDLTLNLPEDYTDIRAYRCDKECKEILERTSDRTNLTCGGKSLKEITLESLQKIKRVEPFEHINATKILTQEEPTISIAGYKITLHLQKTTTIELNTPKKQLPPPTNPSLGIIGTPLEVNIEDKQTKIPAIIQLPFTTTETNPETIAIFVKTGNGWKYLGGQTENNTITLQIEDINQYSNATFAVMGLLCLTCKQTDSKIPLATKKPILTKVYDPGVTDAIILVHGFGAAATWQPFIDDYVINEQPWQLWVLSYPTTNTVEENSLAFSDLLEQNHYQFERATIVAHSLGTLLTRQSLNDAHTQPEKYHFLPKIKQTILISGPGEGTPTIDAIKNIITRFINEPSALSLFNLNPFVEKDLRYGKNIPTTPKIDYYVLAGTMPYWFNIELFKNITYAQNDGIVSTRSAQKVGDNYVNNTCKNYYEINLSHMELNDHELSRKIIERIITQTQNKKHEQALIGKNQYFRLILKNCTTSESIYVVGKPIPPKAAPDPTGCGCGNGVCGIDETETSCPSDCAKVVTVESTCLLLPLPIITLLILSTLLLIIILLRKHLFAHDIALIWYIIEYTLIAITTTLVVYETLSCSERLIFPPYILALIAILTFTDTIIKKQELTPSLNKIIKRKIANVQKIHNKLEKLSNKYEQERKPETRQKYQTLKEINEKINTITRTVHKQLKRFK